MLSLNLPGIYLFFIPSLNVGYVGSSSSVAKRYEQHKTRSHQPLITNHWHEIEFMVLEYLPGYNDDDIKHIEKYWIDYYKSKNVALINKADPVKGNQKKILKYSIFGSFVKAYNSLMEASNDLNISPSQVTALAKGDKLFKDNFILFYATKFTPNKLENRIHAIKSKYVSTKYNSKLYKEMQQKYLTT